MVQQEKSLLYATCQKKGFKAWALVADHIEKMSVSTDQQIHQELLAEVVSKYVELEQQVDGLLKNTLPAQVADVIKYQGHFTPQRYDCSILFTDIAGFTKLAEQMSAEELISILDRIFSEFDTLVNGQRGTKIKTIGDSYMAVFGAPDPYANHAELAVRAALDLIVYVAAFNREYFGAATERYFNVRLGIHSGTVMAGVVGKERMQFDIFGDDVNIAARYESSGCVGKVNISEATRLRLPPGFLFEDRGLIPLKNKAAMRAYFVAAAPPSENLGE